MPDVLTALLRHVRIETSLFGRIELGAPWGARVGRREAVLLHHLVEGEMWLELDGREIRVSRGDLLLLPHGIPHCLRHRPGAPVSDEERWMEPPRPGAQAVRRRLGGDGSKTVVLCAAMSLAGAGGALLLRALPSVVLVGGGAGEPVPGLGRLLDGIRDEVRGGRPGAPVMAARFAELLLLQAIRAELERPAPPGSFRAALGDERVARALDALYKAPERAWTVATLAREAGMSRSGFAHAFREQVGESPLRHLTRWRMELAKEKLRDRPELALAEVASSVGYRDEAAFNVAFRREVGVPPGAYRAGGEPRP
ncbi:AraC family transcriptional regulator [Sorangium sp. So ce1335]|uniref:AraC family transcriptional regulator n=1 Tax=Sorangium sp. So ce1335 TaxID=3133335 RepID=UPI003F61F276